MIADRVVECMYRRPCFGRGSQLPAPRNVLFVVDRCCSDWRFQSIAGTSFHGATRQRGSREFVFFGREHHVDEMLIRNSSPQDLVTTGYEIRENDCQKIWRK